MSVRDGRLTAWDFWGDNYAMLMTPISPNRFVIPGVTLEFSPAEAGRPQSWHLIDGAGQPLLELPLVKFEISKAALPSFVGEYLGAVRFLRDARGAVAGFTLNRMSARGVRFERVKAG